MMAVSPRIHSVPRMAGSTPAFSALREGTLVIKSQSMRLMPSLIMPERKIASMSRPKSVHAMPNHLKASSTILLRVELFILLLEFIFDAYADVVQDEREHEERNAGCENGFV